jgi:hypothetical protein
MKIPTERDPVQGSPSVVVHEDQATELVRSIPLKSTYNSTFIVLVVFVAATLALILVFWPSGGLWPR